MINDINDLLLAAGPEAVKASLNAAEPIPRAPEKEKKIPTGTSGELDGTDIRAAEIFNHRFGDNVRYDHDRGSWLIWDGMRWKADDDGGIYRLASKISGKILAEASRETNKLQRESFCKWAHSLGNQPRQERMLSAAKNMEKITTKTEHLDSDPWLINTPNGILDLKEGKLHQHDREKMLSKITGVACDKNCQTPVWNGFISQIFDKDQELIEFLRRWLGYALSGSVEEQSLLFFYGSGRNGKSTLIEVLHHIWGSYSQVAPASLITANRKGADAPTNDIARLVGIRLATAQETELGSSLAETKVKKLTGGDTLTARYLHREFFDFTPTHKLIISGNHRPQIRGNDTGMWRRIHMVPFNFCIPENEVDLQLVEKLKNEAPGIFAWIVEGGLNRSEKGIWVPKAVKKATQDYRESEDLTGQFLNECCSLSPGSKYDRAKLYSAYKHWVSEQGLESPISRRQFNTTLTNKGYTINIINGRPHWVGIAFKEKS